MARHHLLPLILGLILFILPSSSHAQVDATSALFSDSNAFLPGGQSLSAGDLSLSLSNDCGLVLYQADSLIKDFQTSVATSGCYLSLNSFGQLVLHPSNEKAPTQFIGQKGKEGDYAMLFVEDTLSIYGPAIWNNSVPSPASKQESAHAAVANNFLVSPRRTFGNENGDVLIAQNGVVSAYITDHCTVAVRDDVGNVIFESSPRSNEPRQCFLFLDYVGMMLLQYEEGSQLHTQWTAGAFREPNLFVAVLRFFGRIAIYGLRINLPGMVVPEKDTKMVTA